MTVAASDVPVPRVALFCSTEDNVGQTRTLVNVALVLAGRGRRVLIVDDRGGQVRAGHYLSAIAPPAGDFVPGPPDTAVGVAVKRFRPPAGSGVVGLLTIDEPGPAALARLARPGSAEMGAFDGYDHVLVDAPMAWTDSERDDIAGLPDLVVACFTLNSWSIEGAAALARRLRERSARPEPITVIAAGLKADTRMQDQLATARMFVRDEFQDMADDGLHYVEIPYVAAYALAGPRPAELAPETAQDMHRYFGQLADELAERRSTAIRRATVVYTPRHQRWAEWTTAQLEGHHIETTALPIARFNDSPPAPGAVLLMIAPTRGDQQAVDRLARISHPNIRLVLVDDLTPAPKLAHHEQLDLRRTTEAEAVVALRRGLHLPAPTGPSMSAVRFPRLPERTNLAPRDPEFVGRDETIAEIGAALRSGGGGCVLLGDPGIGKSALALEFCHRFGGDYDLVWRLSAVSRASVQEGLLALAGRLDLPSAGDVVAAVLTRLAASDDIGRWLLLYDDAPGGGELDDLIPSSTGAGDVVVTSREIDAFAGGRPVSVPPLSAAEGQEMLVARVPGLRREQAQIVGQTVGYVPLTVGLAAAWLEISAARGRSENLSPDTAISNSVSRFSDEFRRAQAAVADDPDGEVLSRAMLELSLDLLSDDPGVAIWRREAVGSVGPVWLLETCALLSGDVPLDLLKSPAMQHALARASGAGGPGAGGPGAAGPDTDGRDVPGEAGAGGPGYRWLSDPFVIDVALWSLARYRLIEVELSRPESLVRQHRVLSELIARRKGDRRDAHVAALREVLSRYSSEAKVGGQRRADAVAVRHLEVLRPWEDRRQEVRHWVLRQLRSLIDHYDRPSLLRALDFARKAEAAWRDDANSAEYLRLLNLLARTHRELGEYPSAGRRARQALRLQRAVLGLNHPRSLLSGDAYGSILWAIGEFQQARTEIRRVVTSLSELLGPSHPATLQVQHNLAIAEVLTANPQAGLERLQDQFNRLRAIGGANDRNAWEIATSLAFCQRVLGQNRESYRLLKGFLRRGGPGADRRSVLPALQAENGLAVAERRIGELDAALERHERVLDEFARELGEDALATVSCRAGLAADLHRLGKHEDAVELASRCLRTLVNALGADHPFSRACGVNLSAYQRAAGALDEAVALARESRDGLTERLGDTHLWTLAAKTGLANLAAQRGDLESAAGLEREVLLGFDELGLGSHPDRKLVYDNLKDSESGRGSASSVDRPFRRKDIDLELPVI
jgi:tetratricopeptide (TPR) repeat protein